MSGQIPRSFIDQLLSRADIVELINSYVPLKKAGKNWHACCPFHKEKTPSFTVNADKQFYYCFGCGAGGNAISFVMNHDRLEFVDTIEMLAARQHLTVPYEKKSNYHEIQKISSQDPYQLLVKVADFYQQNLRAHNAAVDYLKRRGLTGEIAKRFMIGVASASWDAVLKKFTDQQALLDVGLLIRRDDGGFYDRFRDRIMFPIRDLRGRVIAFGGRVLTDELPKYLNSPETAYFHKGRELYGLYEARQSGDPLKSIVVVEGYLDVIALAQHEVLNAVATLGTATSTEHVERLAKITKEIIFCFDGDRAGREAAWRALENTLPAMQDQLSIRFLFLPDGEDPDSYVRQQGGEAFKQLMTTAKPLSEMLLEKAKQGCVLSSIEGLSRFSSAAAEMIAKLPMGNFRDNLIVQVSQVAKIKPNDFRKIVNNVHHTKANGEQEPGIAKQRLKDTPMRSAIYLLLSEPQLISKIPLEWQKNLAELSVPGMEILQELFALLQEQVLTAPQIFELWRDKPQLPQLLQLLHFYDDSPKSNPDNYWPELRDALKALLLQFYDQQIELLSKTTRQNQEGQALASLREVLQRRQQITNLE